MILALVGVAKNIKNVVGVKAMYPTFKRRWRDLAIVLLCLALVVVGNMFVTQGIAHDKLLEDYEWSRRALENSTERLVEAREALVPRQFESYDAMEAWVDEWVDEHKFVVWGVGNWYYVADDKGTLFSDYWDCDDPAEAMARDARIDGYLVNECLVGAGGKVCGVKVSDAEFHAGCMATADNVYYYIEPQSGEIVRIINRD